ncbi:MAG: MobF family relaxase [Solirubrobacterales bacterium]
MTKIQRGNAGYWLSAVAQGGEDYYTKPGEAPGEWVGDLADELGLSGQVDPAGYSAILEGRDPNTGAQLLKRPETRFRLRPDGSEKRVEPVLGYDVRFSAPKSVSLLYALGGRKTRARVVRLTNDAVRQGIRHLEQEACAVQRGKGGVHIERGTGFVGMAFRHRMSRAGDPALHVHVVISNLTRAASDGKWLSLASPKGRAPLFPHGKSAGVVFQAALRAGFLREFGFEFDQIRNGYADIKGFSSELIEAFSTRSREIAAWMQERGVFSVKAAQTAAYRTRKPKDTGVVVDERVKEWEAQAKPFGFSRQSTEAMIATARPREPRAITDDDLFAAVAHLEMTTPHFDRRQLLWAIADQLPEGATLPQLDAAVDRALATDRVLLLHSSDSLLQSDVFTTPRVAETERAFIEAAVAGTDAGRAVVDRPSLDSVLARHSYLGEDQREMVVRLTSGGEQVIAVAAWPGTGKTTALKAAAQAWDEAGFPVLGCATAATVAGTLKADADLPGSVTIARLRYWAEGWAAEGRTLPRGTVLVVDEANVTSSFDLEALRSLAHECGGKLVLIGDPKQIGAIGPGGLYVHFTNIVEPISLTTIRRQHREADRRIVTLVHEGRGSEALDLLRTEGKLIVGDDLPSTLHGLLLDWHRDYAAGADAVMIARRNLDVDYLNDRARELRQEEGKLGRLEIIVGDRPIAAGDRVQTRINSRDASNRDRWDVISVNPVTRSVKLRLVGGDEKVIKLKKRYLERTTPDDAPALQYAYAITKFGAESKTFDRAYPLLDPGATLEQELVAISRGREIAKVYTVATSDLLDPDLGPGRRDLTDNIQDAREAIERDGADFPALEVAVREEINSLSPTELADRRYHLTTAARAASPDHSRRDQLDRQIARDRDAINSLSAKRAAAEQIDSTPATDLTRLVAAEASAEERIRANLAERDTLPDPTTYAEPKPTTPRDRLEAALIEQRIARQVRAEITAGRAGDSHIIYRTLGPCPEDPAGAATWGDAAHGLASYRLRYNVRDPEAPLGQEPRAPAQKAERAQTLQRIETAQRALRHARDRALEQESTRSI